MGACAMPIESSHNAAELGELTASGNPPIKLASLADVVRHVMRIDSLPLRPAARRVIDALEAADPLPDLYLTCRADYAAPVAVDYLVRKGQAAVEKNRAVVRSCTNWSTDWGQPGAVPAVTYQRRSTRPAAAVAERRGVPGLLAELREAWAQDATGPDALNLPRHARIAMRDDVAQALFCPVPAVELKACIAELPAAVPADALPPVSLQIPANPPSDLFNALSGLPSDEEVLRELEKLTQKRNRKTTAVLVEKYGVSADTIQRAAKRAKKARQAEKQAAAVPSSVFHLASKVTKATGKKGAARP